MYKRQEITYFKPDERKAGGAYVTATGAVIKVDDFERLITMPVSYTHLAKEPQSAQIIFV